MASIQDIHALEERIYDAVKHSRLGRALDFGEQWVGIPCSQQYWEDIKPIFDYYKTAA